MGYTLTNEVKISCLIILKNVLALTVRPDPLAHQQLLFNPAGAILYVPLLVSSVSHAPSPTESLTDNISSKSLPTDGSVSQINLSTEFTFLQAEPSTKNVTFGIPYTIGFKIAALNIASLSKHIDELDDV